jgi:hypothetical protein
MRLACEGGAGGEISCQCGVANGQHDKYNYAHAHGTKRSTVNSRPRVPSAHGIRATPESDLSLQSSACFTLIQELRHGHNYAIFDQLGTR